MEISRYFRNVAALALFAAITVSAQAPSAQEMTMRDEPATFRERVNLVMVPVVVRDRDGKAVGNLRREDFHLFDNGKPQVVTKFSVEKPGEPPRISAPPDDGAIETAEPRAAAPPLPARFIAFLFDDVHIGFSDLARSRDAVLRYVDAEFQTTDRAAILTTSGQGTLDFTDERPKIRQALMALRERPVARVSGQDCPRVTYYMADQVRNKDDQRLYTALIQETIACMSLQGPGAAASAKSFVDGTVSQTLSTGEHESRISLLVIRDAIGRLASMPGQRLAMLVSPGFLTPDQQHEKGDIIDRAVRSSVVISALDARGVYYVDPMGDISSRAPADPQVASILGSYVTQGASLEADVLAELAHGTGGRFVQNTNDLGGGVRQLASVPEYMYVLGFQPQNLKLDGKFHALKVTVERTEKLSLQVRRGYYAPRSAETPDETARREIEEALFSRDELREIPVQLRTQFFKLDDANAKLSVISRIDLRALRFRKAEGRHFDNLTVITGLFDRNGRFLSGTKQLVEMRFLDQTMAKGLAPAVNLKASFDVHPGEYAIRLVVRDSEGQMMSAGNGSVEIP